jgi:hypothetical protein
MSIFRIDKGFGVEPTQNFLGLVEAFSACLRVWQGLEAEIENRWEERKP